MRVVTAPARGGGYEPVPKSAPVRAERVLGDPALGVFLGRVGTSKPASSQLPLPHHNLLAYRGRGRVADRGSRRTARGRGASRAGSEGSQVCVLEHGRGRGAGVAGGSCAGVRDRTGRGGGGVCGGRDRRGAGGYVGGVGPSVCGAGVAARSAADGADPVAVVLRRGRASQDGARARRDGATCTIRGRWGAPRSNDRGARSRVARRIACVRPRDVTARRVL